jgi:regulator of sirC expression with transglutaminase-like and TPR domain
MDVAHTAPAPEELSKSRQAALLSLLGDDDPLVYQTVREKILSYGRPATEWLRPHTVSNDPALRRRARELVIHFDRQAADDHFLAFCLRHGEDLDVEEGAWLLAQTRYPLINTDAYRALLDSYAIELGERLERADDPLEHLSIINRYLFRELGFGGNEENYYDPENSYLNCVLDRRKGNPINLCLVYLLVARRLRLPIAGIGLPGHFVCRYQSSAVEIYFDPFNRGKILSKGDCLQYLAHAKFGFSEETLTPISPRRLLLRVCNNLHQIYQRLEQANEATRLQRYVIALGERYRTA